MRNFWWHGIALMEAAATRGVHGDAIRAATDFLEVIDHWDRVGDWSQQWVNLRYVTRLLSRLGADDEAFVLHRCLLAAGKQSPLHLPARPEPPAMPLHPPDAVALARSTLRRYA